MARPANRAIRWHQLKYEPLAPQVANVQVMAGRTWSWTWCAGWRVRVGQVLKKHNNIDHKAKLCTAVAQLSEVLRNEQVESPMKEFDQSHTWQCKLHVVVNLYEHGWDPAGLHQSWDGWQPDYSPWSTVMLPWLTIYDHTNFAWWWSVNLADMTLPEETLS